MDGWWSRLVNMKTKDMFILGLRLVGGYGGGVLPFLPLITALLA